MNHVTVSPGGGDDFDWSSDHVFVKTPAVMTDGRVTVVEDRLKPGFLLARHHHERMVEVFYVLEGEVTFAFDDETVVAVPGTTVNIPPGVRHEVTCPEGGRLLTVFTPGGFDDYLLRLSELDDVQFEDAALMEELNHRFDIWAD